VSAIAARLNFDRKTVRKYLVSKELQVAPSSVLMSGALASLLLRYQELSELSCCGAITNQYVAPAAKAGWSLEVNLTFGLGLAPLFGSAAVKLSRPVVTGAGEPAASFTSVTTTPRCPFSQTAATSR
jgi:hypothetical protein